MTMDDLKEVKGLNNYNPDWPRRLKIFILDLTN